MILSIIIHLRLRWFIILKNVHTVASLLPLTYLSSFYINLTYLGGVVLILILNTVCFNSYENLKSAALYANFLVASQFFLRNWWIIHEGVANFFSMMKNKSVDWNHIVFFVFTANYINSDAVCAHMWP
jgi:hypothetical protein